MKVILEMYKRTLKLLRRNLRSLVEFEIVYKLIAVIVATPLLYWLFSLTFKIAGISYVSNDNIKNYLTSPLAWLMIIIVLAILAFVSLFDIVAVIEAMHASAFDKDIAVSQMFRGGLAGAKHVFHWRNWLMVIFVVLIVPLTNVVAVSGFVSSIKIPGFIMDFIEANKALSVLTACFGAVLVLMAFKLGFCIHTFSLEKCNYLEARRRSLTLMKGNYIRSLISILLWEFFIEVACFVIIVILSAISFLVIKLVCFRTVEYSVALITVYIIIIAVTALQGIISVPLVFAHLSGEYYEYKEQKGQELEEPIEYSKSSMKKKTRNVMAVIIAITVIGLVGVAGHGYYTDFQYFKQVSNRPEICAHRGYSLVAPENSMPAFKQAIKENVDWIELDVHETKDGVIVVTHDADIKRIAGVDKNVYDLTYAQLEKYDVGSWFSSKYKGLHVSTLDEVIKVCKKGHVKLQIELKPTGHEKNFEKKVINVVERNHFEKKCMLASLNADCLKTIKKDTNKVKTLYIMAVAIGEVPQIKFADGFSVEESFVKTDLVNTIHKSGKQIFVWTVNTKDDVRAMEEARVDVILTDDPVMVKESMNYNYMNEGVGKVVGWFFSYQG